MDVAEELEPLEDVEHLQLTLQEAFFLIWNLDCLTVLDPHTVPLLSSSEIYILHLIILASNPLA